MRIQQFLLLVIGSLSLLTCAAQFTTHFATKADIEIIKSTTNSNTIQKRGRFSIRSTSGCNDPLAYIPDTNHYDHTPWKYIRVNFHWMNSADSSHNFYGKKAKTFVRDLLNYAGKDITQNNKLWLPYGNNIPVISPRIQYRLTPNPDDPNDDGIYEHFDDNLCYYIHKGRNRNLGSRAVLNKYGVQQDSVLNIFIMPHHPDSVASRTYTSYGVGVAIRNFVKIAGPFEMKTPTWTHRGNFNHEVAHILGLGHAWLTDGCDDTPEHELNCWNRTDTPPCDKEASNNMMDYNALQQALSPCQIGKIQANIAREGSIARKFIDPTWCQLNEKHNIVIKDSIIWKGAKDIEGNLTIANEGTLIINCRLSMPKDAKIIVEPKGTLILQHARLHNACGLQWKGIELQQIGKDKGRLIMTEATVIENNLMEIR